MLNRGDFRLYGDGFSCAQTEELIFIFVGAGFP
jgi:hypothetical protein